MVNWLNEVCSDSWKKCVLWPFNLKRSWFEKIFMIQSLWVHDRIVINVKLLKKSCRKLLKTVTNLLSFTKKIVCTLQFKSQLFFIKVLNQLYERWSKVTFHMNSLSLTSNFSIFIVAVVEDFDMKAFVNKFIFPWYFATN